MIVLAIFCFLISLVGLTATVRSIKRSMPRKKIFQLVISCIFFFFMGTGLIIVQSDAPAAAPVAQQKQPSAEEKSPASQKNNNNPVICNVAGLGDTRDLFIAAYGTPKETNATKIYKNGKIIVMEGDETKAFNITIYINSGSIEPMDKIKDFIPKDAKTIQPMQNTNEGEGKSIYIGESESLSKIFSTKKFIVIRKVDKASHQNTFIISSGDQP